MELLDDIAYIWGSVCMARKIKFPLTMGDGVKVRNDLDELRQHADFKHIMEYFVKGKLEEWLTDREYIEQAKQIAAVDKNEKNAYEKICKVLDIEYKDKMVVNIDNIERVNDKRNILLQITSNKEIVDNAHIVAFSQEELFDLIKKKEKTIYLYSEKGDAFVLPENDGIEYIGIGETPVIINDRVSMRIKDKKIKLKNILKANDNNDTTINTVGNVNTGFGTKDEFFAYIEEEYGLEEATAERFFFHNKYDGLLVKFIKLSKSGIERANYFLTQLYDDGCGSKSTDMSHVQAQRKKCEKCTDPLAKIQAVYMYDTGDDKFSIILNEVYERLREMAVKGDPFACYQMYNLYQNEYKQISRDKAIEYAKLAAEFNYPEIYNAMGVSKYNNEEYKEANEYFKRASNLGSAWGSYNLANCYMNGLGVTQNINKAFELYKKAAMKGLTCAEYELGEYYFYGIDGVKIYKKAFEWYDRAALKNYPPAQNMLGLMLRHGWGCKQSDEKAYYYYKKSAKQDHPAAIHNIGHAFFHGIAYKNGKKIQDYKLAFENFMKVAEESDETMYYLGTCYQYGLGTNKDWNKARYWYKKAAEQGNDEAKKALKGKNHRETPTGERIGNFIIRNIFS